MDLYTLDLQIEYTVTKIVKYYNLFRLFIFNHGKTLHRNKFLISYSII